MTFGYSFVGGATRQASDTLRAAALALGARGWSVIPVAPHGKRPLVAWTEYQQRPATLEELTEWLRSWPDMNIGIVTGAVSGIVVLDVDERHGGGLSLAQLETELGPIPMTVEVATGGSGRHLYFRHPGGRVPNRVGLRRGLDLRGDGGCVVAPPSVHPSGRRYAWVAGRSPQELHLAALPAWAYRTTERESANVRHPLSHWRELVLEGVAEGERNSKLASLTGHLLWRGVDPHVALELLLAWNQMRCRPPLPDEEVAGVVESIVRLHARQAAGRKD